MSEIFDTGKQLGLNYTPKDDRVLCIITRIIANKRGGELYLCAGFS